MATTKSTVKKETVSTKAKVEDLVEDIVEDVTEEANEFASEVSAKFNENLASAQSLAKRVWFAGLGAVGRSADEIQTRYNKASDELQVRFNQTKADSEQFVKDLVARGEKVQDEAEVILKEGRSTIEEQIEVARERITSMVDIPARLQDVSEKLESLSKSLKKTA